MKPPSPAQKVLTDFRHTTTETVNTEAKSLAEILKGCLKSRRTWSRCLTAQVSNRRRQSKNKPMKMKIKIISALAAVGCTCLFCVMANAQTNSPEPYKQFDLIRWKEGIVTVTNVVVPTNYAGTIQISTNFYTVDRLRFMEEVCKRWTVTVPTINVTNKTEVEWLGFPSFGKPYQGIDPGFYRGKPPPSMFVDETVEIGLRPDGVLIWRKRE